MPLSFVHAADFHLAAEAGALQHGVDTAAVLARAVSFLNVLRPACIVAGGDLTSDGSETAAELMVILSAPASKMALASSSERMPPPTGVVSGPLMPTAGCGWRAAGRDGDPGTA